MSRIGRKPIPLPAEVEIKLSGNDITVKGPKGELRRSLPHDMRIDITDGVVTVTRPSENRIHRSMHGLTRTLIANMVQGVSEGFRKNLEIVGVGYRAQMAGEKLALQLGYSHPVEMVPPEGIAFSMEGNNRITVAGINKELVGETAAKIRSLRPPDHYKGKGVRYQGEYVRLKAGKAGKAGGKK